MNKAVTLFILTVLLISCSDINSHNSKELTDNKESVKVLTDKKYEYTADEGI